MVKTTACAISNCGAYRREPKMKPILLDRQREGLSDKKKFEKKSLLKAEILMAKDTPLSTLLLYS